jgi:hypothetical protein
MLKPAFKKNQWKSEFRYVYMKMSVSVRIFSSFVVPVPGMEVRSKNLYRRIASIDGGHR